MSNFIITKDWLNSCMTENGAYTKAQGKVFGILQFRSGWKKRLIGRVITEDEKQAFEAGAKVFNKDKVDVLLNKIANLNSDQKKIVKQWVSSNI